MANALKQAREHAGLTQAQLAQRVGVDSVTVSRWERGEFRPSAERLLQLAEVLNVSPASLLGRPKKRR